MKTKIVTVRCKLTSESFDAAEDLLESLSDGVDVFVSIDIENLEKSKLKACYVYEDSELSGFFSDEEICEDISTTSLVEFEKGNFYFCKGIAVDLKLTENKKSVILSLEIPLMAQREDDNPHDESTPEPPAEPQTYIPIAKTPELQTYEAKIVGINHHTTEETYEALEALYENKGMVTLRPEPNNEYDPMAVAAFLSTGEKVGYIASQYLAVVHKIIELRGDLSAEINYLHHKGSSANIIIKEELNVALMPIQLFSLYTPAEVYKASYVHRLWGGISEKGEKGLFATDTQRIDFALFSELPIDLQNRIAKEWEHRMDRATVENPTNPGGRMTVRLDLSVYDTSWKELDLSNSTLLKYIEAGNEILAIYVRARRIDGRWNVLPLEQFLKEFKLEDVGEVVIERMRFEFENKRL